MSKRRSPGLVLLSLGIAQIACSPAPKPVAPTAEVEAPAERRKPQSSPLVREAEQLLAAGEALKARDKFEESLGKNPRDARAWLGLGLAHEALSEPRQAEGAYLRALEIEPELAEAHNNRGLLLRERGELEPAIEALRAAVRADPQLASAQVNLALALEDAGRDDDARGAYERAVQLSPEDALLRANFGLFLLARGDATGALVHLRAGARSAQADRATLVTLGNGLRRAGQPDEAVRALRAAIEAGNGRPTPALLSELALAQQASGDSDGAKISLGQALALDPRYATAHYVLGSIEAAAGNVKSAREHYQRCIQLEPKGPLAAKAKEKLAMLKKQKR